MKKHNVNPNYEGVPDPEEIRERYPIENDSDALEPFDDRSEHREINSDDPDEIHYWTQQFQITKEQLHDAIALNGISVRAIKKYLSV